MDRYSRIADRVASAALIDQKRAMSLVRMGYKHVGVFVDDEKVLADLERIGAVRQPVEGKWYWLFPDEISTKRGKKILKEFVSQHGGNAMAPGFLQHSAVPDSKGRFKKM